MTPAFQKIFLAILLVAFDEINVITREDRLELSVSWWDDLGRFWNIAFTDTESRNSVATRMFSMLKWDSKTGTLLYTRTKLRQEYLAKYPATPEKKVDQVISLLQFPDRTISRKSSAPRRFSSRITPMHLGYTGAEVADYDSDNIINEEEEDEMQRNTADRAGESTSSNVAGEIEITTL